MRSAEQKRRDAAWERSWSLYDNRLAFDAGWAEGRRDVWYRRLIDAVSKRGSEKVPVGQASGYRQTLDG